MRSETVSCLWLDDFTRVHVLSRTHSTDVSSENLSPPHVTSIDDHLKLSFLGRMKVYFELRSGFGLNRHVNCHFSFSSSVEREAAIESHGLPFAARQVLAVRSSGEPFLECYCQSLELSS